MTNQYSQSPHQQQGIHFTARDENGKQVIPLVRSDFWEALDPLFVVPSLPHRETLYIATGHLQYPVTVFGEFQS